MQRRSERLAALQPVSYRETGVKRVFKKIRRRNQSAIKRVLEESGMKDSIPSCSINLVDQRHVFRTSPLVAQNITTYMDLQQPVIVTSMWITPARHRRRSLQTELRILALLFILGICLRFMPGPRIHVDHLNKENSTVEKTLLDPPVKEQIVHMREVNESIQQNLEKEMGAPLLLEPEIAISTNDTEDINKNLTVEKCYILQANDYKEANYNVTKENYALKPVGAYVVKSSKTFKPEALLCLMGICWNYQRSPNVILQTDNAPGNCWAMDGSHGYVTIKLSEPTCPAFLVLDHLRKEMSLTNEISTAPRNFSVYGFKNDIEMEEGTFLGSFVYNINDHPTQMFKLEGPCLEGWQYLQLVISSNWNNPNYTCIYEVRVYN